MSQDAEAPKREPTPTSSLSSIPQKRAHDDTTHNPVVPSPLNAELDNNSTAAANTNEPPSSTPNAAQYDDAAAPQAKKSARAKKDSYKKREAKGGDSGRATPDPKPASKDGIDVGPSDGPLRYKLAPPKPSDFEPPRGPILTVHHEAQTHDGGHIEFLEASDHVANKKNFRYTPCIADPLFPSTIFYRQTEAEPFGPRMSYEDAAAHVYFDRSARQVTTDKGYRMAKANVAVRSGRWYWECKITRGIQKPGEGHTKLEMGKHVRMGWARREASLDAPVGFDAYSYGIRDVSGEKVHMSRPSPFFPPQEGIREGDVIGLEIQLPSEELHRNIMSGHYNPAVDLAEDETNSSAEGLNIVRDRVPIRFKAHTYFEKIEYHSSKELEDLMNPTGMISSASTETPNPLHTAPALRSLPNSCIKVYKNGVLMGTAFENLLGFLPPASKPMPQVGAREGLDDGMLGYYPALSIFRGGAAEVNFGPDFWYPPSRSAGEDGGSAARLRPLSERYEEQIAEDVVYDVVDEVDFWMQDGGGATDRSGVDEKSDAVAMAPGREEIKELVQED